MSSFISSELVHHMRLLSDDRTDGLSLFKNQDQLGICMAVYFVIAMVGGCFLIHLMARCVNRKAARSIPTREEILGRMCIEPTVNFTNELSLAGDADHRECTICLSEFVEGEEVRVLTKCKHGFHGNCIELWFMLNHESCPTCRTQCVKASSTQNPPQQQQQQQNDVNLETEMVVQQQNDIEMVIPKREQEQQIEIVIPEDEQEQEEQSCSD